MAGYYGLGSLVAILDMNRLGQRGPTDAPVEPRPLRRARPGVRLERARHRRARPRRHRPRLRARREASDRPTVHRRPHREGRGRLVPRGQGGLARQGADAGRGGAGARRARRPERHLTVATPGPTPPPGAAPHAARPLDAAAPTRSAPRWRRARRSATRSRALGAARGDVVALDGEVSNSTYTERVREGAPRALLRDVHRRAADGRGGGRHAGPRAGPLRLHLRRLPHARLRPDPDGGRLPGATSACAGSHAGVSIGEDGPSQMALEDLAMMRAVHGSTVLYPCDANQTARARRGRWRTATGISYLRTTREKTPVLYGAGRALPHRRQQGRSADRARPGDGARGRDHRCTRR